MGSHWKDLEHRKNHDWMCTLKRPLWLLYGEPWWDGAEGQEWVQENWSGSLRSLGRRGGRRGLGLEAAEDMGVILGLRLGRRDKGFAGGLKVLRDGKRGLAEGELLGFRPKQVVE